MTNAVAAGIVRLPSSHGFDETAARVEAVLQSKGLILFAVIDHSGEAAKVGLTMPATKLFIFGSPKAGTPLMVAAPTLAIDLPLKILVSADERGHVWISYNSPTYLRDRHAIPDELVSNIAGVEGLAQSIAS